MNRLNFKQNFVNAQKDYLFLLERGYKPKGFLELVGNRYQLSSVEKTMLYRGLVVEKQIKSRRGKTIHSPGPDDPIHIDTLNVVTTISSYLLGLPVFISGDGFLRDASQKRGKLEKNAKISEAVHLLIKYLEQFHDHAIYFWLDDTGAATELILNELHLSTSDWKSKPITEISQQVDKMLISTPGGVICSSDSGIIDKANSQLFDLAIHTLISAFDPEFIAIQKTYKS